MCATCGCEGTSTMGHADHDHGHDRGHSHDHDHGHDHHHGHAHSHPHAHDLHPASTGDAHDADQTVTLRMQQAVLAKNDKLAERNRGWLSARGVLALNLVSSPGAGKTTLLERTIRDLGGRRSIVVIEGDQATSHDADRIRAAGARAVQVNTGTGCHLDAAMIARALPELDPPSGALVAIENVGNLVCPALFDLGEAAKVLVASVTEGDDKPIKYPHMFRASALVLLNKVDLLGHVRFDVDRFTAYVRDVNRKAKVLPLSATSGQGLDAWYAWIEAQGSSPCLFDQEVV